MGLYDQLSRLVETGVGTIGPLDASDNAGQKNTNGATGLVTPTVGLHTDHTGLSKTVALEDGGLREESSELFESFVGKGSSTAHDGTETGEVDFLGFGTLAEHDGDGWHEEEVADLVFGDALKHASEAELGHDHKCAAAVQLEEQVVEHSVDV